MDSWTNKPKPLLKKLVVKVDHENRQIGEIKSDKSETHDYGSMVID